MFIKHIFKEKKAPLKSQTTQKKLQKSVKCKIKKIVGGLQNLQQSVLTSDDIDRNASEETV